MAMFRARKARSCFMRLLIAHAVTRKGFACKTRRAATRLEKRSRPARGEVLLQEIRRDVEGVIAVRGALELSAADDLDAVLAHKSPDTALFDTKAQPIQLLGHAWSSLAAQAQAVLVADVRQDLGHSLGPMAFMPSTYRAACDATGACASRYGARALKRPSGGTDGCGSGCRNTWQYPETSRLLSREERRRFFWYLPLLPQNAVLFAQPLVLAQKLGILRGQLGFLRNRPDLLAEHRKPDPQIRRNLTPCQATGERNANRIPLELVAAYRCHTRSS